MSDERRRDGRAPIEVKVEYRTVGSFLSDWTVNISRGGLFISTLSPLKIGAEVRLVFSLPGIPIMFDLHGTVKWIQDADVEGQPPGMGVEFFSIADQVRQRIEGYVDKHQDEMPKIYRPESSESPIVTMKTDNLEKQLQSQQTQPFGKPLPDKSDDE